MLKDEYIGLCAAVPSVIDQFLKWFAFFTGVNLVAYGWFAAKLMNPEDLVSARRPVLIVASYFVTQNVLAVFAAQHVGNYMRGANERLRLLLSTLSDIEASVIPVELHTPVGLYAKVVSLVGSTFYTMILLWLAFVIYAYWVAR